MTRTFFTAALVSVTLATSAFAMGTVELTDENKAAITALLTEQGYEVAKIKIEDGEYEAYAKKDGHKYEVFLNGDFEVITVKDDD